MKKKKNGKDKGEEEYEGGDEEENDKERKMEHWRRSFSYVRLGEKMTYLC